MARQLHELGVGYYCITIMQGSAHLIAPNETFDKIAGTKKRESAGQIASAGGRTGTNQ